MLAAAADKACEVLGSGALAPEIGSISYGTTATINTTQRRYVEAVPLVPPYPAAVPGRVEPRGPGLPRLLAGRLVQAPVRRRGGRPGGVASASTPEALFDDLVRATEPGSMGLVIQPTWTPGVRIPGREAKGAMIGFGDVHTRAHVYRAILEGLAFALREGGERAAARAKVPLRELRVSGGGAQSPAAIALTADIFGLPVGRPHTHETSGLGAAIDAAVGLGIHSVVRGRGRGDDPASRRRSTRTRQRQRLYDDAVPAGLSPDVRAA